MELRKEFTGRGFAILYFVDRYGMTCTLQKSSLATEDCVWFGREPERMHLSQDMVRDLLPALQHFVDTGELP